MGEELLMSEWTRVEDGKPYIPKGKHGVLVLVVQRDETFEEMVGEPRPMVNEMLYMETGEWHGMLLNGNGEFVRYAQTIDKVTHWMYLPDPPEVL